MSDKSESFVDWEESSSRIQGGHIAMEKPCFDCGSLMRVRRSRIQNHSGLCKKCFRKGKSPYIYLAKKLQAAEEENKILREAVEFYATFCPRQFPEGYYEICIEEGMGGHNKFGTIAQKALEKVRKG